MDQQAASSEQTVGPARPPGALAFVLSIPAIAIGALLICCLVASLAVVAVVFDLGRDGASEMVQELKFDSPLKTQIGVFVVSALYLGLAGATFAAAWLRGRRGWAALVAWGPTRRARESLLIMVATIAYAGLATYALEHDRDRHLLVSGPTDLLLVGTIVTNLVILAPLAEELFFRGWFYTGLRRALPALPSVLVTIVFFAAIHWDPNHRRILQVLPLAVALALLRERSGSIKPTIALHAMYNLVIVIIRLAYT